MLATGKSKRFEERRSLSLRLAVRCPECPDSQWEELTRTLDISSLGARFTLRHRVETARLLHLSLTAMPRHLRAFDHGATEYRVWALVRSVNPVADGDAGEEEYEVGVAFTGKSAPEGYLTDPGKRYDLKPVPSKHTLWSIREQPRQQLIGV